MPSHSFKKGERLKSRKVIEQLFSKGQSFSQYPLRLVWMPMEERKSPFPVQFAASVSKKKFPRAVGRNQLRRKVREAYRLQKHRLYDTLQDEDRQLAFMVLYVGREVLDMEEIEKAMRIMLKRFTKKWNALKPSTNREQ